MTLLPCLTDSGEKKKIIFCYAPVITIAHQSIHHRPPNPPGRCLFLTPTVQLNTAKDRSPASHRPRRSDPVLCYLKPSSPLPLRKSKPNLSSFPRACAPSQALLSLGSIEEVYHRPSQSPAFAQSGQPRSPSSVAPAPSLTPLNTSQVKIQSGY